MRYGHTYRQAGQRRKENEGARIGTVRRPLVSGTGAQCGDDAAWQTFEKHYRREMKETVTNSPLFDGVLL